MKKVLFFDMYQTLVDTQIGDKVVMIENAYKAVFSNFLLKNNIDESLANEFQLNYKKVQDEFYLAHDKETEHHDFKKLLAQTFRKFYSLNLEDKVLIDLSWQYRKLTRGDTKLYIGVRETLEELSKTYKMFIASYTQSCYSIIELEDLGIKEYFTGFVFSSDIGYKKINDNFYKKCIKVSGESARDCVVIGDNRLEDIYMAGKNGMKTIWIKNPISLNINADLNITPDKEIDIKDFPLIKNVIEDI